MSSVQVEAFRNWAINYSHNYRPQELERFLKDQTDRYIEDFWTVADLLPQRLREVLLAERTLRRLLAGESK
jgi:hypothetical protein